MVEDDEVRFFVTPEEWRAWLDEHHASSQAIWVGFYKVASGRPSVTYPQAVDEALCFGWIDGIRKSIDAMAYKNRFTPRRPGSNWSAINIARVEALTAAGRMHEAGLAAFAARREARSGVYTYENAPVDLDPTYEARLRADEAAWAFFAAQAPWYRRAAARWVMDAKREPTRERRLATLIEDSAAGLRVGPLRRRVAQP